MAFIEMEKAYDRMNRKKLFEVRYGVQEKLVDVIERIYDVTMVKCELDGIVVFWLAVFTLISD